MRSRARWICSAALLLAFALFRTASGFELWYVHEPIAYDALMRQLALFARCDDPEVAIKIDAAYRVYLDESEAMRGDEMRRLVERWKRIETRLASAAESARWNAACRASRARAAACDERLFAAIAIALPESQREGVAVVRRLVEMRRLLNPFVTNQPTSPRAIELAATMASAAELSDEERAILRETVRAACDAVLEPLRRCAASNEEYRRASDQCAADYAQQFPEGPPIDADAVAAWQRASSEALAPLARRACDSMPAIERRGYDALIAGFERLSADRRRQMLRGIVGADYLLRNAVDIGAVHMRRCETVLARRDLSAAQKAEIVAIIDAWRKDEGDELLERIRVIEKCSDLVSDRVEQNIRQLPTTALDAQNALWEGAQAQANARWKTRIDRVKAIAGIPAEERIQWSRDTKATMAEAQFFEDPDEQWQIVQGWTPGAGWSTDPITEGDVRALCNALRLDEETSKRASEVVRSAGLARANREQPKPIDIAQERGTSDEAVSERVTQWHAQLRAERAERDALVAVIVASINAPARHPAIDAWVAERDIAAADRLMSREINRYGASTSWLSRAGNPAKALHDAPLSDEERAAAQSAMAPLLPALRDAERALESAELDASVGVWLGERRAYAEYSAVSTDIAKRSAVWEKMHLDRAAIIRDLAPIEARRVHAQRAIVDAIRGALSEKSFEDFSRALRRTAFPRIDHERDRFERVAIDALALDSLDEARRAKVVDAVARWSSEFEERTERLASLGYAGLFMRDRSTAEEDYAGSAARWTEFRRRQEGFTFLASVARVLTPEERAKVPGLIVR